MRNKKKLATVSKSVEIYFVNAKNSVHVILSIIGIVLIVIGKSTVVGFGLSLSCKVETETLINKRNKIRTICETAQQTVNTFDKIYRN